MSLMLKGIDLPTKKQKTLIVEIAWDGDVWVDNHDRYELKYNSAIQIPKGHGRLGDLDEIGRRARASYRMGDFGINEQSLDDLHVVEDIIDNAPTILEAEE